MKDFTKKVKLWTAINDLERVMKRFPPESGARFQSFAEILSAIAENPDISFKELAGNLNLRQPTLTEKIKKLEAKGLILKSQSLKDKRSYSLKLTDTGLEEFEEFKSKANFKSKEDKILSEKERKTFIELCNKLTKGLNDLNS